MAEHHGEHDAHGHEHDHGHGAHDHSHGVSERRLALAAIATGVFMLVEVGGGLVSGSLALLADAGHMLTDFAGLGLAWYGFRLARRPADWRRTFGWDRFAVLAAFTNGIALFAIAAWITIEAWQRLSAPHAVAGGVMGLVALGGLVVNAAMFALLHGGDRDNLNMRAALLHVLGDLLGSVAALVAAAVIVATGWTPIDPLLSVLVAAIILRSAWRVVAESGHILLEGTPEGIDNRVIATDLVASVPGIAEVHHVHAWSINERRTMVTLHARAAGEGLAPEALARAIKARLKAEFGVEHATVEIEHGACADGC